MSTSSACRRVLPCPAVRGWPSTSSLWLPDVGSTHMQRPSPSPRSEFPNPSGAVFTVAYCSVSPVDKDTTWCFLAQRPPLMITPADTDRRVTWSPPQSEFWAESFSSPCASSSRAPTSLPKRTRSWCQSLDAPARWRVCPPGRRRERSEPRSEQCVCTRNCAVARSPGSVFCAHSPSRSVSCV